MPPKREPYNIKNQEIIERRGHKDYIRGENGQLTAVRTWDHHSNQWRLTSTGRKWAAERQSEFVVSIPVIMTVTRKNGDSSEFKGYLPASNVRWLGDSTSNMNKELKAALGGAGGMDRAEAINMIKINLLAAMRKYKEDDGDIVLFYESDAVATYDESPREGGREWLFSELWMEAGPGGSTTQDALLDVPMRAPHYSHLVQADNMIPEAFHTLADGVNCCCYQLAALLKADLAEITQTMKVYFKSYYEGDFFVSPRMMFDYCASKNISCYFWYKNQLVSKRVGDTHSKGVAFTTHDNHCFILKDANWTHNKKEGVYPTMPKQMLTERPDKNLELTPWDGKLNEGSFWTTTDLSLVRQELLEQDIVPKVYLTGKTMEIKKLVVKREAKTLIQRIPEDWEYLKEFMAKFKLPYKYEGLPACTQMAMLSLVDIKRRPLSSETKAELWTRADGCCELCGGSLDDTAQIDHKTPLCEGVDPTVHNLDNLRYLCITCHAEVSQHLKRPSNVLLSHFNPKTYDEFVLSPLPAQCVQKFNKIDERVPVLSVDIKACRRSALTESELEWPIYCALDEFQPIKQVLHDFNFVDAGLVKTAAKQLRMLPYQGPRFYSRQACQWMLKRNIITWDAIKLGYSSSGKLPRDFFKPLLKQLEEAFKDEAIYKKAVNSMIGCWFIDKTYRYHCETSKDDRRLIGFDGQYAIKEAGCGYVDHIEAVQLVSLTSMSPILRQVLDRELTLLSEMIHWLELSPRVIKQTRVDSIALQVPKKLKQKV